MLGKSPINVANLKNLLKNYPLEDVSKELLEGFQKGFRLNYHGPRISIISNNLRSAEIHKDELLQKINKEVSLGRVAGPFPHKPISNLRINPVGLVPKKSGGWRLISHLSSPLGSSINDFIDPEKCSVSYSSFDNAVQMIQKLGKSAKLGKKDISSAFRLLPLYPGDFCLTGFKFLDHYYIDKCLPMGCSVSCSLFEKFSSFLQWAVQEKTGLYTSDHYLDDFLFLGRPETLECELLMQTFDNLCKNLGVPIAEEKNEGPVTRLCYLGLGIDTEEFKIYVPEEKIIKLKAQLNTTLGRKKVTLKELQSLTGSLAFCSKALPAARAFNRRFYGAMSGISKSFHRIRVTKGMKEDIKVWLTFLDKFNGCTFFPDEFWITNTVLELFTDSSGSLGCGAYFQKKWLVFKWPLDWGQRVLRDITFLELVPIVLAILTWSKMLTNKKVLFHVDNSALVDIINSKSSKSDRVMCLLRPLVLTTMNYNIQIKCSHIAGSTNEIADSISRFQWTRFRQLAPEADTFPTPIPSEFWPLLDLKLINC